MRCQPKPGACTPQAKVPRGQAVRLDAHFAATEIVDTGFEHWVLIRRSRQDPEAYAYYIWCLPRRVRAAELAGAAGLRWTIEECFQRAKEELGLDHCEARSWHGWHRHMTLCMAAAVFLAKLRADLLRASISQVVPSKRNERSSSRSALSLREPLAAPWRHRSLDPISPLSCLAPHTDRRPRHLPIGQLADAAQCRSPKGPLSAIFTTATVVRG